MWWFFLYYIIFFSGRSTVLLLYWFILIGAVVLAGGGIGYYFKIYKPKHEAPDLEDDYCEYEDGELEEIAEEPEDEDTPPWEEDTEE